MAASNESTAVQLVIDVPTDEEFDAEDLNHFEIDRASYVAYRERLQLCRACFWDQVLEADASRLEGIEFNLSIGETLKADHGFAVFLAETVSTGQVQSAEEISRVLRTSSAEAEVIRTTPD